MRVDLGLQHLVAGLLQHQLFFVVFVDQGVDLPEHHVKLPGQSAHLVPRRVGGQQGAGCGKVAPFHHLHRFAQVWMGRVTNRAIRKSTQANRSRMAHSPAISALRAALVWP